MIKVSHLNKKYENAEPIKDINLTINDGDIISIIGSSGCGKSTFLRCLIGLENPTGGTIEIDNNKITDNYADLNPTRLKMAMVFQSFNLFPHMTVIENVMKPQISILGRSNQEAYDKAIENLKLVGMDLKALKYPDTLSGGQKQRVAIARTLSMDPEIILFDEPTSALDPASVEEVQSIIRQLSKLNKTMLIVTHEMRFAREISNRVLYFNEGYVYDDGTPEEIFDSPQKELTRRFVKRLKVFEKVFVDKNIDYSAIINELSNYGYKNEIDSKTIHKLESCFEELCLEIIMPKLTSPVMLFSCEYNDIEDKMFVTVMYNCINFNPMESDNELSLSILNSMITNVKYIQVNDGTYTNRLTFELK